MKKIITRLLTLSVVTLVSACSPIKPIEDSSSSEPVLSSSSREENSSSSKSSSSNAKSSSSNAGTDYVDNQLSTPTGLTFAFSKTGAAISSIKWGNTQIARDGFVVGRVANRIANGQFTLNGQTYNVSKNDGNNSLHGGQGQGMNSWRGPFATKDWTKVSQTASSIVYSYSSADGENGYPGKMDMTVTYTLSPEGELSIEYSATTTKDTLCNPTNHLFIDISGSRTYNNVKLWIDADNYTPLNSSKIPTGAISPVEGTQFDYRTEKNFDSSKSYDDNLVLNGTGYRKVASLSGTNYEVEVFTDRPGLQLYKENNGSICLETQMMPDAINQAAFEDPILRAGETFSSKTAYRFGMIEH